METSFKAESILNFPKDDLCPEIWKKTGDSYSLTPDAEKAISKLVNYFIKTFKIPNCIVNITGSITSNLYDDDSDIDVHFHTDTFREDLLDDFNRIFRKEFADNYAKNNSIMIGNHPLEIYFQGNIFQDYMSIGCYDFTNKKWIVGPEFENDKYNPYSEYYRDIEHRVSKIITSIRDIILQTYEKAVVLNELISNKSNDSDLYNSVNSEFNSLLVKSGKLFEVLRKSRKISSAPTSLEDALEKRDSEEWHIADATFKLLDKYGYLGILKQYSTAKSEPDENKKIEIVLDNFAIFQTDDEKDETEKRK